MPNALVAAPHFEPKLELFATIPGTGLPPSPLTVRLMRLVRGDIYELKTPQQARGHEQHGSRLAVVVQSDDLPLSTWLADCAYFHRVP